MKMAVMGAGAVGCYYGAMLARQGHEVVLIGRALHVDAVRTLGLRLETADFDQRIKLAASTEASAAEGAELVLFCVKSTDTEAAGALLAPWLAPQALVLCLQNGVDNADRLRGVLPQEGAVGVSGKSGGPEGKKLMLTALLAMPAHELKYSGDVPMERLDEHSIDALAVAYCHLNTLLEDLCLRTLRSPVLESSLLSLPG